MITGEEIISIGIVGKDKNGERKTIVTKYFFRHADMYHNGPDEFHLMQLKMLLKKFEKEINEIPTI